MASTPKNILVFGATGPLGLLFVDKALENHHELILYVRSTSKVPDHVRSDRNVTIILGEITNAEQINTLITQTISNKTIIVSFLGPNTARPLPNPAIFATFYQHLFDAIKRKAADDPSDNTSVREGANAVPVRRRRVLALATISVPAPGDQSAWSASLAVLGVKTVAASAYKSMVLVGQVFAQELAERPRTESKSTSTSTTAVLAWTLFRVGGLADGEESISVNGGAVPTMIGGDGYSATVKRADVARWVLQRCEAFDFDDDDDDGVDTEFVDEMPLLCSPGSGLLSWRPGLGRMLGLT